MVKEAAVLDAGHGVHQHGREVFPLGVGRAHRPLAGKRLAVGGFEHDRESLRLRRRREERDVVQRPDQRAADSDGRTDHDEGEDDQDAAGRAAAVRCRRARRVRGTSPAPTLPPPAQALPPPAQAAPPPASWLRGDPGRGRSSVASAEMRRCNAGNAFRFAAKLVECARRVPRDSSPARAGEGDRVAVEGRVRVSCTRMGSGARARAPSTMLRMVPLPRCAGRNPAALFVTYCRAVDIARPARG